MNETEVLDWEIQELQAEIESLTNQLDEKIKEQQIKIKRLWKLDADYPLRPAFGRILLVPV